MAEVQLDTYTIYECEGIPVVSVAVKQGAICKLPSFFDDMMPNTIINEFYLTVYEKDKESAFVQLKKEYVGLIQSIKKCIPLQQNLILIQLTKNFQEHEIGNCYSIEMILGLGGFYLSKRNEAEWFNKLSMFQV